MSTDDTGIESENRWLLLLGGLAFVGLCLCVCWPFSIVGPVPFGKVAGGGTCLITFQFEVVEAGTDNPINDAAIAFFEDIPDPPPADHEAKAHIRTGPDGRAAVKQQCLFGFTDYTIAGRSYRSTNFVSVPSWSMRISAPGYQTKWPLMLPELAGSGDGMKHKPVRPPARIELDRDPQAGPL